MDFDRREWPDSVGAVVVVAVGAGDDDVLQVVLPVSVEGRKGYPQTEGG